MGNTPEKFQALHLFYFDGTRKKCHMLRSQEVQYSTDMYHSYINL